MPRFVVIADKLTAQQQDALTNFVKAKGWNFWHWFESTWLLHDVPESITSKQIAEEIDATPLLSGKSIIAMKVSGPIDYWGRSPKESWDWMQENWGRPGS